MWCRDNTLYILSDVCTVSVVLWESGNLIRGRDQRAGGASQRPLYMHTKQQQAHCNQQDISVGNAQAAEASMQEDVSNQQLWACALSS